MSTGLTAVISSTVGGMTLINYVFKFPETDWKLNSSTCFDQHVLTPSPSNTAVWSVAVRPIICNIQVPVTILK